MTEIELLEARAENAYARLLEARKANADISLDFATVADALIKAQADMDSAMDALIAARERAGL